MDHAVPPKRNTGRRRDYVLRDIIAEAMRAGKRPLDIAVMTGRGSGTISGIIKSLRAEDPTLPQAYKPAGRSPGMGPLVPLDFLWRCCGPAILAATQRCPTCRAAPLILEAPDGALAA